MRHCLTVLLLGTLAATGCGSQATGISPSVLAPQAAQATLAAGSVVPEGVAAATPSAACQARGLLPDPACTPGSLNPAVTPATIDQTICVPGYTTTIRPPVGESNRLKRLAATAYGVTDSLSNYEGDHLIALELGGAPDDIANFWDEPHATSFAKDELENRLRSDVCAGRAPLAQAQHDIATDWVGAYCAARLPRCRDGVHFR
jgi:hypothetical protein